ncbi:MAG: molecular chaperone DnaJ [Patescibacteria group bacterium]|nr:molecular chaperone DnaJ [Patescibacteria group bacterium]
MSKDYYNILGVGKDADENEIKKAYRKLAHKYHPDKKGGDEAKFKEINQAYQVLSNKEKRAQYDQYGSTFEDAASGGARGGFNWQDFARQAGGFSSSDFYRQSQGTGRGQYQDFDFGDLGDIFGDIFGFGGRSSQRQSRRGRARDIEASMNVDFMEAVFGAEKFITLDKNVRCEKCQGSGAEPGSKIETCKTCGGSGQVQRIQNTFLGQMRTAGVCPDCQGQGQKPGKKCSQCGGQGIVKERKEIKVKIPAGIDTGQAIRLAGQGEAAPRGRQNSDLYIRIKVNPDSRFERRDFDIYSNLEISFSEAALGTKKPVETVDGEVSLKIPSGVQTGKMLRLKNKGVPRLKAGGRGDHYVKIIVKTPGRLNRKQKKIFKELAEEE